MRKHNIFNFALMLLLVISLTSCFNKNDGCDEHNWVDKEIIREATCQKTGEKICECTKCHETKVVKTEKVDHSFTHYVNNEASCTHDATATASCDYGCGKSDTKVVGSASSHNYQLVSSTELSCEHDKTETWKCSECGDEYTNIIEQAKGHNVLSWTLDSEEEVEQCHYEQHYKGICETCHEPVTKVETVEKHSYTNKVVITKEATCQESGLKTYYCECGEHQDVTYENENAHIWVADASSTTGTISYHCDHKGCDATKSEIVFDATEGVVSVDDLATNGVQLSTATIKLDEETLKGLSDEDITLSAEILEGDELKEVKEKLGDKVTALGDNKIYNFSLSQSGNYVSDEFDGYVTVSVPYELAQNEDPESIAIWYVNDKGEVETVKAEYANGVATFKVKHFSYYTVTRLSPKERCELYGHIYKDIVVNPTCTENGYTLHICQRCGHSEKGEILEALGHDLKGVTTEATCTANGKVVYSCQNEGCHYTYTTIIQSSGHKWVEESRLEATCSTTGLITYKCHCGATHTEELPTIEHDYKEVSKVEASCGKTGLITYECHCGKTKTEVISALSHKWKEIEKVLPTEEKDGYIKYECEHCKEKQKKILPALSEADATPNLDLLLNALSSILEQKMTLVLKDVHVRICVGGSSTDDGEVTKHYIDVKVKELYLTLDEDNVLVGSGNIDTTMEYSETSYGIEKFYIYGSKVYALTQNLDEDEKVEYENFVVSDLVTLMTSEMGEIPTEQIEELLKLAEKWYDESFHNIIDSIVTINGNATKKLLEEIVSTLFTFEETETGHTITLNVDKLQDLADYLYENTLYDIVEGIFGSTILENIDLLFDFSVKDLMLYLEEKGLVLNDVLDSLDDLVAILSENEVIPEGISTLDELLATLFQLEDLNIKEIINSDSVKNFTIGDLVLMIISMTGGSNEEEMLPNTDLTKTLNTITLSDIKAMINSTLEQCKAYTLFSMIAEAMDCEPEELKSMVDSIIEMACESLVVKTTLDKDNNIIDAIVNVDVELGDYAIKGTLTLDNDYEANVDNKELKDDFEKVWKKLDVVKNLETILDNLCNTDSSYRHISYEITYNEQHEATNVLIVEDFIHYNNGTTAYGYRSIYTFDVDSLTKFAYCYASNCCGDWKEYTVGVSASAKHYENSIYEITRNDNNEITYTLKELGECTLVNTTYNLNIYYNLKKEAFTNSSNTEHKMATRIVKEATGCTGKGIKECYCKNCDYSYTYTYTNGHKYEISSAELMSESHTCYDGIMITYKCSECDATYNEEAHWHCIFEQTIDLSEYGSVCGKHFTIVSCPCGEFFNEFIEDLSEFHSENIYDYGNEWMHLYTCPVTDPKECGFKFVLERKCTILDNCRVKYTKTYYFGVSGVEYDENNDTYKVIGSQKEYSYTEDWGYYEHNYKYESIEKNDTYHHYKEVCKCGSYREYENTYDDEQHLLKSIVKNFNKNTGFLSIMTSEYMIKNNYSYIKLSEYKVLDSDDMIIEYDKTIYEYNFDGKCSYEAISYDINGEVTGSYDGNCCQINGKYVSFNTDHPCTQDHGEWVYTCDVCGTTEDTKNYVVHPDGHCWEYDETLGIYVCKECGLKNATGTDGLIILEDCTTKDSDTLTVGYYVSKYHDSEYVLTISLILKTPNDDGNNEIFVSFDNFNYATEGRFVSFSKAEIQKLAKEMGYSEDSYNIRLSFVPTVSYETLDYGITFE